jgi:hypothetical protein
MLCTRCYQGMLPWPLTVVRSVGEWPDENDIPVVAAALSAHARIVVTSNVNDFPQRLMQRLGLEAENPRFFPIDIGSRIPRYFQQHIC